MQANRRQNHNAECVRKINNLMRVNTAAASDSVTFYTWAILSIYVWGEDELSNKLTIKRLLRR